MSLETTHSLDSETVDKLQDLTQMNIDSRDGLRYSADQVKEPSIATMFREAAEERSRHAAELQHYVTLNEREPKRSGSMVAAVHRSWIAIRDTISSNDLHAVLAEAERGEDHIKAAYEDALKRTAGSAVNDVLQRQYACVKKVHDRVRDLRDSTKKK